MRPLSREPCAPGAPADKSHCPIEHDCEDTGHCLIQALRQAGCVAYRLPTVQPNEPLLPPSIKCPECGMRSWHPRDVAEGYCANCHAYTTRRT